MSAGSFAFSMTSQSARRLVEVGVDLVQFDLRLCVSCLAVSQHRRELLGKATIGFLFMFDFSSFYLFTDYRFLALRFIIYFHLH